MQKYYKSKFLDTVYDAKDLNTIKVHVHTIYVSDVEDPEIYLARPLCDWKQTEKGKWVMEHSFPSPSYHCTTDPVRYRYIYNICAYLTEKDYTYYRLKFE